MVGTRTGGAQEAGAGAAGGPGVGAGTGGEEAGAGTGQCGWTSTVPPPGLTTESLWRTCPLECPGRISRTS